MAAVCDDGSKVGGGATSGQQRRVDEFSSVGTFDLGATDSAVGEAANFFDVGLYVQFGVGSFNEVAIFERLACGRVDDRVYNVVAVGIIGVVKDGVIVGWEAPGGFIAGFVSCGVMMTAWASSKGRWSW